VPVIGEHTSVLPYAKNGLIYRRGGSRTAFKDVR
jgi:hypothetical protein